MTLLLSAAVAVFVLAAVAGDETAMGTMPKYDCSKIPWVGHVYNETSKECVLTTTYGGCTPPKGFINTCAECQTNATGGEADERCIGLKVFIHPATKTTNATSCKPSVRWQWHTYYGGCSNLTYGCLAEPKTVGFDTEKDCLETCESIPHCGVPVIRTLMTPPPTMPQQ